jgi:Type II secretion system (T2SS), protein M subtype b
VTRARHKRLGFDVRTAVTGVTAVVVVGGLTFTLLSMLSRPQDFKSRVRSLDHEISRVERLSKSKGDAGAYAAGAICDNPAVGANALETRARNAAAAASVALTGLSATPPLADDQGGPTAPVALQFSASGKYEAVVAMLSSLDRDEPEIFVDAADLKPAAAGQVTLKLTGRILCWTSARH